MRIAPHLSSTLFLLLVGCVTPRFREAPEPPPIPVYSAESSVPCAYEAISPVQHRTTVLVESGREYFQIRDRELGRIGEEMGADAVIVAERRADRPLQIAIETPMSAVFEGTAIRFTDADCLPG